MLRVVENLEPLTVPEQKLLEKVQSGEQCNFLGADESDRCVRAAVLKAILSAEGSIPARRRRFWWWRRLSWSAGDGEAWGIGAGAAVDLCGAVVSGDLTGFNGSQLPPIRLQSCRLDGRVDFAGATFTGT